MFREVMKKGVLFMPEPHFFPGAAPYWFFLFDYAPFLRTFAAPGRRLFLPDYADRTPYPGWRVIYRLARQSVVQGKGVSVSVDFGGRRLVTKTLLLSSCIR